MYHIAETQWKLTKEEQVRARFMVKMSSKLNGLKAAGKPPITGEAAAYELFKSKFYLDVSQRLGIHLAGILPLPTTCTDAYAQLVISSDGKKVTGYRVEE